MAKEATEARQHHATFARDKKNPGKYLVRVMGPHAGVFAGREVPVERMDKTEEMQKLLRCVWLGVDDKPGPTGTPPSGKPVALYTFEEKPREEPDALPF